MEPLLGIQPSPHAYEACVTSNMTREALLQIVYNCEWEKIFNLNFEHPVGPDPTKTEVAAPRLDRFGIGCYVERETGLEPA